ncbi:putative U3 small nucleolar ribonucleoprotein [Gregarina niphandrodes]|uniref:U3 small nucleolar ribonucleoprotein n=1 Tax=Gregarina niphandrodes TaxID=110365 RepID=A0A023B2X0_GRENI|nr:putative U3 small nucleolar ribonucleoprotein [Gregarina niphandrodes]EZG52602.1 putative U3 small nucleolar ribonucleoprotein [Gregarina niphandrodes]|eukprot:XP_011131888.1 putative U3 small nucleolar ribonucleoprotein [Gregarina niphandrodes]
MLRQQQRQLREYLNRKRNVEEANKRLGDVKRLREALDTNKPIPSDLRGTELPNGNMIVADGNDCVIDDEYRLCGTYDPRILITTSQKPTGPCIRFAKEFALMVPNSTRVNRGQMNEEELMELCKAQGCTDYIQFSGSDGEGRPTLMVISHLPYGPTAHFTIRQLMLRSDLSEKPPKMKQALPHLIFHNFDGQIGHRIMRILKFIFPKPSTIDDQDTRVISFINLGNDVIYVRHHTILSNSTLRKFRQHDPALKDMTTSQKDSLLENIDLDEQGPRFTLEPFKIIRGIPGQKYADIEWQRSYYVRKSAKILGTQNL